ncbi:MAG: 2-C-methyl-D-erythritol 2,4-cyclodiphosphate synthase [Clostridiales bacterium]|nr:2-C-methyl-D-erythritol 2,4-cyclodiphosphate synthase [Clostridiales bacterium]
MASSNNVSSLRIGQGYDVHKLVHGRRLVLCGEEIPHEKGLLGHSDADVATHALIDSLLGAAGLGDIGRHFPDSDVSFKDANSLSLLARVVDIIYDYTIINVDLTIVAQEPKLAGYIPKMQTNLVRILRCDNVNIKATTTEGLGFEGRCEGISAKCVCLLQKNNDN